MAQLRESSLNASSPPSSNGLADSFKGTPDTRLTAFSQDDDAAKFPGSRPSLSITKPSYYSHRTPFDLRSQSDFDLRSPSEHDPFVSGLAGNAHQKLSPTASTFQPVFVPAYNFAHSPGIYGTGYYCQKLSLDLGISRFIIVKARAHKVTMGDLESFLDKLNQIGIPCHGKCRPFLHHDSAYLGFTDIRDAYFAFTHARLAGKDIDFHFTSHPVEPGFRQTFGDIGIAGAQLYVVASVQSPSQMNILGISNVVYRVLQMHGQLFAFVRVSGFTEVPMRAIAEYCDSESAAAAEMACRRGVIVDGVHLSVSIGGTNIQAPTQNHEPDRTRRPIYGNDSLASFHDLNLIGQPSTHPVQHVLTGYSGAGMQVPPLALSPGYNNYQASLAIPISADRRLSEHACAFPRHNPIVGSTLMHRSASAHIQEDFSSQSSLNLARADSRRQHAARLARSLYHSHSHSIHHNHVDIGRIREGTDVRTTIMLRNIPNKVDQAMLKRMVDESSWGKYDFMYLRIDFANDCNVGYAFINFVDPLDIIDFVNARGNQRWNCFKSDKVAEISYATIQGKDCLVQKFRNSSVMLEAPHYRPKLYHTSNGPFPELAGHEEPFPDPDNQSKMKRSCENAEHVGLFTPNAGQHFRDEQRRRRSQYDRGTRLAALEEYDFEAAFQATHVGQH